MLLDAQVIFRNAQRYRTLRTTWCELSAQMIVYLKTDSALLFVCMLEDMKGPRLQKISSASVCISWKSARRGNTQHQARYLNAECFKIGMQSRSNQTNQHQVGNWTNVNIPTNIRNWNTWLVWSYNLMRAIRRYAWNLCQYSTYCLSMQKSKADGKSWLWKRAVAVAFKKSPFVFDVNFEVLGISWESWMVVACSGMPKSRLR